MATTKTDMRHPKPFRFGIQTGPFDDPVALREFARKIEDLGYAELWSYDHIGAEDPFLPLLVAAEATTTLRFGPLVINNELHNPVLLARTAATFDRLSGGRLLLGMGTGYMRSEHDAVDIPLRAPGPRVTRFGETLEVLRKLLDDGAATFAGEHLRIDVDDLGVRPAQARVPIVVGGHGRRVVGLAGRHADMFQFTGLTHHPETGVPGPGGFGRRDVDGRHGWLRSEAGDRFGEIEISTLVQRTRVGDGAGDLATEIVERWGLDRDAIDGTPFALLGSVDDVVDKLQRLRAELDIHHVVVRDPDDFAPIVAALAGS